MTEEHGIVLQSIQEYLQDVAKTFGEIIESVKVIQDNEENGANARVIRENLEDLFNSLDEAVCFMNQSMDDIEYVEELSQPPLKS